MIKKHGNAVFFCIALNVGAVRPKPRHKGLFVKSPLESQKLCQNKVVYLREVLLPTFSFKKSRSVRNSLAYLSYKKGRLIGDIKIRYGIYCVIFSVVALIYF